MPDLILIRASDNSYHELAGNTDGHLLTSTTGDPAHEATTVTVYNISLTNANTEYSQALPANTRRLCFRSRTGVQVRYAWSAGKVATPTAPYQTLMAGAEYAVDDVKLAAATLYLASATAGATIELECWA